MKHLFSSSLPLLTVVFFAVSAPAQSAPPAGATGLCKDGTYTTAATKSGACRGHQGVKEWLAASSTPATSPKASASQATTSAPAAPAPATAPAASSAAAKAAPSAPKAAPAHTNVASMAAAAGGAPGMVWLNTESKTYHCYGSQYYGKTKQGAYMSEADAKAKGAHADHNHPCSK